MLSYKTELDLV